MKKTYTFDVNVEYSTDHKQLLVMSMLPTTVAHTSLTVKYCCQHTK